MGHSVEEQGGGGGRDLGASTATSTRLHHFHLPYIVRFQFLKGVVAKHRAGGL